MTVIAVAGGTGGVGRAVVESILATQKYEVKIFSRKPNPELEVKMGVSIVPVDYSDVKALTEALEINNVHTVISTMNMLPVEGRPHEIELIRAADASKATRRMISSSWGIPAVEKDTGRLPSIGARLEAQATLRETRDLEHTVFHTGFFLDFWTAPGVPSHMFTWPIAVDVAHDVAAIPGSGDVPIVFTHVADVARFVAASLGLPEGRWDPDSYVVGDRLTWNEFLELAEEAKGTKFEVTYDSVDKLQNGQATLLPGDAVIYPFIPAEVMRGVLAAFGLWTAEGALDFQPEKFLNDVFPEIKPMKVREGLQAAWKKE